LVFLVPGETGGMETYARELIPRLASVDGIELTAFVNRETAEAAEGPWLDIPHQTVPVWARNRVARLGAAVASHHRRLAVHGPRSRNILASPRREDRRGPPGGR